MHFRLVVVAAALLFNPATASWFGKDSTPEYKNWDKNNLEAWLHAHNINAPSSSSLDDLKNLVEANWNTASVWTTDQYNSVQKAFTNLKDDAFDTWDESNLRQFLLEQGIVAPKSTKEQLALIAKQRYNSYTKAAASLSAQAENQARQATQTISSWASASTDSLNRQLDDSKDYIYSTWSDNEMRTWLEKRGYIKTQEQATRDQLLAKMREYYLSVADPVWTAWSTSYMHEWLVNHGLIKSDYEKKRAHLIAELQMYYYNSKDYVYSFWSDSELREWLIDHDVIKSDAQIQREKMIKLVQDNYAAASDTIWAPWKDSEIRAWLVDHGYLRSDAQVKRDELVKLINEKYTDVSARTAEYLTWPDARLRAYLRQHGVNEASLPNNRPDLLHEVRIRYIQSQRRIDNLLAKIRAAIANSVETAEEKLGNILDSLTGAKHDASRNAEAKKKEALKSAKSASSSLSSQASQATKKAKEEL